MSLTPNQNRAALHTTGHAMVLAGAGSGKSTMLVARIGNLIGQGIAPSAIMVAMFNKDAATQFQERLKKKLHGGVLPKVSTYHSIGSKILIEVLEREGLLPRAQLQASDRAYKKMCLDALSSFVSDKKKLFGAVYDFMTFVDLVKSSFAEPLHTFRKNNFSSEKSYFVDAYRKFERLRATAKVRFFADLIYDPMKFLKDHPEHVPLISNRYDHIMIDEYQDINDIQHEMMVMLAGGRAHVMVVGDDDQCIYGWRGANPEFMISGFQRIFANVTVYDLLESFRYGHQIAMASHSLITNNVKRTAKLSVSADSAFDTTLTLDVAAAGQRSVCKHIVKHMETPGAKLTDIAVLVRAFSHAVPVEIALLESGIPYMIEGGEPLFEAADVGSVMAGLYVISGHYKSLPPFRQGELASRFASYPPLGLDSDPTHEMLNKIRREPLEFANILGDAIFDTVSGFQKDRIRTRANAWRNLGCCGINKPGDALRYIMKELAVEHEIAYSSKNTEEEESKRERFDAIIAYADQSEMSLHEFVDHVTSLMANSKSIKDKSEAAREAVTITSLHRSKGLEFPLVIIPRMVEGKFPLIRNDEEPTLELFEEERRLLYVGMTRAMKQLVLIAPNDPILIKHLGQGLSSPPELLVPGDGTASRFLYEINAFLCQQANKLVKGDRSMLAKAKSPEKAVQYLVANDRILAANKAPKVSVT